MAGAAIEARRLLQTQGIANPTGGQVNTLALKLQRELNVKNAQQKVAETKAKATAPRVTTRVTPPIQPQDPFRSQLGRTPSITAPPPSVTSPGVQPRDFSGESFSAFDYHIGNMLREQLAPETRSLGQAFAGVTAQNIGAPTSLAESGQFSGLTPEQARRLVEIERGGLGSLTSGFAGLAEQRNAQLKDLREMAGGAFKERQAAQEKTTAKLDARRQNAINDFLSFRQKIVTEGGQPDAEAGAEFMKRLQESDNPEVVLDQYYATAAPFVRSLFAPKKTGGGTSAYSLTIDQKRKAFALGFTKEQIENPTPEVFASVFAGERTTPGSNIYDVIKRVVTGKGKLTRGKTVRLSEAPGSYLTPTKRSADLQAKINEAKSTLSQYKSDPAEMADVRDQILERAPELAPYI